MRLRDLMKRGLAVHHAGLLPIAKEMLEMLFCQGYIKVLFCTETFAMGVNAPTRTVVFHSIRKHDGKNHRYLLPSEYTQMAGRAGRRGLDAVGTVLIACWDELPPESEVKTMLTGRGVSLESQFRLTYSMILNLLRTEDMKVEDMLKRSFAEWRAQRSMPKGQQQLEDIERRLARARTIPWPQCIAGCCKEEMEDYLQCTLKIEDLNSKIQAKIMLNRSVQQSLVTGRVVLYSNRVNGLTEIAVVLGDTPSSNSSWAASEGAVAAAPKVTLFGNTSSSTFSGSQASSSSKDPPDRKLYLLTLHKPGPADKKHSKQQEALAPPPPPPQALKKQDDSDPFAGMVMKGLLDTNRGAKAAAALGSKLTPNDLPRYSKLGGYDYLIIEAGSRDIIGIGKTKVKIEVPQDILDGDWEGGKCRKALTSALLALSRVQEEEGGPAAPYLMDFRTDLKVADIDVVGWLSERDQWMARRVALRPHSCTELSEQFGLVRTLHALNAAKETLTHQLSDASLSQLPEFHQRVSLLQSLGYLDPESTTITLKGRALCEINSTQDELLATEMIFSGLLSDLSPAESVSLLSCLVFQEKSDVEPELPPSLVAARKDLEELAIMTGENQRSHGLQIDPQEYARDALKCGLMQVTYEWACGKPFAEIITCTDVMEGSIVRCIVRLDQACRELMDASRVLGNTELFQKMQAASQAIKRDIVFAASLYVA
jgi:antiviral helicase SKI2